MSFLNKIRKWLGMDLYDRNKVILCEFDGPIHSFTSGWYGVEVIHGDPVPGAIEWLRNYLPVPDAFGVTGPYEGPIVVIYSRRAGSVFGRRAMKKWLIKHGLEPEYIRDNLLRFTTNPNGAWATITAKNPQLIDFRLSKDGTINL